VLASNQSTSFKTFTDCERFVEQTLGISEKDFKKYIIFNLILSKSKYPSDITLATLIETLKKEGKFPINGSVAGEGLDND
jgi:hypothetical protein